MINSHLHVVTERLDLRKTDPVGDLDDLFAIFSDPAGWWFDPSGRHIDPARTRALAHARRGAVRRGRTELLDRAPSRHRRDRGRRRCPAPAHARVEPQLPPRHRPPGPGLCHRAVGPPGPLRWNWTTPCPSSPGSLRRTRRRSRWPRAWGSPTTGWASTPPMGNSGWPGRPPAGLAGLVQDPAEPCGFAVGVGLEAFFGDAEGADAVGELVGVAFAVGFEGEAGLVVVPPSSSTMRLWSGK